MIRRREWASRVARSENAEGARDGLSRTRRLASFLASNDRFLSVRMLSSVGVYLLIAASYLQARITDDGIIYYDFMRRLVGEDVNAFAYQFGVVFWNVPFYLVSRIVTSIRGDEWVEHVSIGVISVAVASTAAVLGVFYVSWRLLRDLGLPGGPGAILLTVFGSPLFYYAIFQPGLKHAFDALLASLMALLLLRASVRPPTTQVAVALGLILALSISVRYANIVLLAGVIYVLLRQRSFSQAYAATATAVVGATAILALPLLLGIPYGLPPTQPATGVERTASSTGTGREAGALLPLHVSFRLTAAAPSYPLAAEGGVDDVSSFEFDFLAPPKMLFTLKRGLFIWTPLTFFGVVGYLLLLRRVPKHRTFLTGLGLSALALLLVHVVWGAFWAGGYSFSQRFLTAAFPVFVIGIAELLARTRMLVAPLLVACIAWTAFLALHHFYGYDNVSEKDGVDRIVELYRTGEENGEGFWQGRITGPVSRHWEAYFDWLGISSSPK